MRRDLLSYNLVKVPKYTKSPAQSQAGAASLTHHLPGYKRRSQAAAAAAAGTASSSTSWSRSCVSHLGRGRLGLRRQQIRKERRGCPGGAVAEPRMEIRECVEEEGVKLLKCYFYLPHFLLGGRLVSAPPSLGPSCLDLPVPFSSGCLLPRLEDKRKRGRRAW